ncbi:SMC family ATPase [Microbacterium jejuense]|uniref:Nuclease SbcCD subunit C n=1 Tax=Microbacterium jejuense TaxID=1263637 RepID=A0ABS7HII8_9MICO|nr:SMC family ATPase [Microbacterium jejuense]MBW9092245.1 SMC family ATPase [Microbacterium jejuense]
MRLHRLELTGFGPFRERQTVDFDEFAREGIFLITGRTGAGKSSILDGVCFALYGSVPRYETGDKRLRSDHCEPEDPTEVRLEFTVGDRRWRVTRAPDYQRPARRGGGMTTEPTRAELEELVEGEWIGRAAKPREVGLLLDEVLGLSAQQFQQVILLAQNKFSRFLLASGGERQSLLRALFGTRRYEEYTRELGERGKRAQQEVEALGERARTLLDQAERLVAASDLGATAEGAEDAVDAASDSGAPRDLAARRAAVELALQRAAYRLETATHQRADAEAARAAAEAAHAAVVALAKSQGELARARERLSALEDAADVVAADRATLDDARAAEALRAPLDAARRAEAAAAAASAATITADDAWHRAAADIGADADGELDAIIERLTGDLAVWTAALAQESALAEQRVECERATADVVRLEADVVALDAQRAAVPAELARIEAELADARERAALLDPAQERRAEVAARLVAAEEAAGLADTRRAAELAHRDAAAAASDTAAQVAALLQRRLDGYAGELATHLVDGEACAVCGATEHPRPAEPSLEPVTDELLAAAEAARDRAAAAERTASDVARSARERHAEATARAGGESVEALRDRLEAAVVEVAAAEQAGARRDTLASQLAELAALDAEAEASRAVLLEALAAARTQVEVLTATIEATQAVVDEARGGYETVAARVAQATASRDAARAASRARDDAARAAVALDAARADVADRVAASPFADAEAATAALRDPSAVAALATRIAEHDSQLAAVRARLLELELELAGAPDGPVDTAQSQTTLDAADRARTEALEAEHSARSLVAALRDLGMQIDDAYAGIGVRADEAAAIVRLADTLAGRAPNTMKMDLETFVLAAELEEIVAAANVRLADMSSGRYRLQHTDARAARGAASGLGLEILDGFTGQARPAQSLSGGETFLASLALALGLAEVVTSRAGGVRLDTLFVDEGFGSLDDDTLDLAMRTLDELRQGGRTVGVISHVAAMKELLPAQLAVEATPHGPSVIRQASVVAH